MKLDIWDAVPIVLLAVIEVVIFETLIRAGLASVERASGTLFILILLNSVFVIGLRRLWRR